MKKTALIFIIVCCFSIILAQPQPASARLKFISFGTGSPAGTYYFLGAGFASIINKQVPNVRVTAESTAASLENATLISRGKMDMGLAAMGTLTKLKARGVDISPLRLIAIGHTSDTHWIVRKDSPIKTIADFKGKRIGVGPAGSGTLKLFSQEALEKGWGLTFDDFSPKYISFSEIITGIRDNTIDAGNISAGMPVAAIMELARDIPLRLVETSDADYERLRKGNPIFQSKIIPAKTYKGIDQDVQTYSLPQMWLCSASMSKELVYQIIKAVYDNDKQRNAIHPMAKMYTTENAFFGCQAVPANFHPGAIKYYKEKGVWGTKDKK
ncbi:MAG: TAXI family TRAP transporter solute-binding subunit [Pseudomonadota bacterium]|nr:TAXI family TRAP transporter solute-binding subunit [Pseudomonadota bacterium]